MLVNGKTAINLQDSFLNHARRENMSVVIYLMNGFQLRGFVRGFDNFTVIIENEGKQQLVYKHAISTITPVANFVVLQPEKREQ
ncbi:MAG: RNA chaperone Hfq [Acidaminococcaceae bacterium]|nr:RNA chaperone Hfq [Acidaminococcaceae bacterium]